MADAVVVNKSKRWRQRHPERYRLSVRRAHLKANYGITLEQYDAMREAQGSCCAVCGEHEDNLKERDGFRDGDGKLHVDHDHQTGEVRSLLCNHCNTGLGKFMDTPELLEAAASYLRAHRKTTPDVAEVHHG